MFFQSMNQMMTPDVDITLVIRKSADGCMAVSLLPKSNTLKNEAQNNIVPLALNGTPEELDSEFLQVVFRPIQKASGLITNMAQFEAQAEKAASSGKGAKSKESKEEKEKREKYEKNLKKAQDLIAARKHGEAVDALTEARKYAGAEEQKKIDGQIEEQKKLAGQGDLFAMMEEPAPAQSQQPAQQTVTAQQQPAQPQPAMVREEPVQPAAQPPVQQQPQQPVQQPRPVMPQAEIPCQPQQPYQQPYGNPGQGYGGQYGYAQPQGWPQQAPAQQNGGYPQYAPLTGGGMMPPNAVPQAAYQPDGQARCQQPMMSVHDMPVHAPRMGPVDPDDEPPYRPGEYAGYPDFPESMLEKQYVQPQMM